MEFWQILGGLVAIIVAIAIGYFILRVIANIIAFIIYGVVIIIGAAIVIAFLGEILGFVGVMTNVISPLLI